MSHTSSQLPKRCMLAVALCYALSSGSVFAQARPDAGTILDTLKQQPAPPRESPGLQLPPQPKPAMNVPQDIKVTVTRFRISGNTLFAEEELLKEVAEFLNKPLGFDDLQEATRAISSFYRGKGYFLAQAYLPKQELSGGVVEIFVIEGRIGKVRVESKSGARLKPWIAEGFMRRVPEGEIATEKDVERPLLLLQDLRGITIESEIVPGAKIGEADLNVKVGDDPAFVSGVVEIENFGNKFAGAIRAGGQVFVNNPFGLGDVLTLRGLASHDLLTQVAGVSYAVPVTYWGTRLGVSYSEMRYRLGGSLVSAGAAGEANIGSILLVHPIIRTRGVNVFGQLSADVKELEDRVSSTAFLEERRIKGAKLTFFGDSRDFVMGGGLNTFSVSYLSGRVRMVSPGLDATDAATFNTAGNFNKVNLDMRRVQRLTDAVHGVIQLSYQGASKNLASAEKISVGGPYAVRAYPIGEGLADEAVLLSAEMRYTLPGFKLLDSAVTLTGFVDGAHVQRFRNHNPTVDVDPVTGIPNANRRTLWGAGIGMRMGKQGNYSLSADLAWRVGNEAPQSDVGRHPRIWVHGVKWF